METQKVELFFQKISKLIKLNFVRTREKKLPMALSISVLLSPTLVIDTSMERSSQVLQHGNPKD